MVRALVDAGANINARDRTGKTPLHYARSPSTVEALVDCCGRVLQNNSAATATSAEGLLAGEGAAAAAAAAGARAGRSMVAEECVAIVDARNAYGSTALHRAAFNGREGVVVALMKGGAGVGVRGKSGRYCTKNESQLYGVCVCDTSFHDFDGFFFFFLFFFLCTSISAAVVVVLGRVRVGWNKVGSMLSPLVFFFWFFFFPHDDRSEAESFSG